MLLHIKKISTKLVEYTCQNKNSISICKRKRKSVNLNQEDLPLKNK